MKPSKLKGRAAIIEDLRALGYTAKPWDWSMGQTVLVTHEDRRAYSEGKKVEAYDDLAFVRENPDGSFTVTGREFYAFLPPKQDAKDDHLPDWSALVQYLGRRIGTEGIYRPE